MARILVTGATGFVGHAFCQMAARKGYAVRAALRTATALPRWFEESVEIGNVDGDTDWTRALRDVDCVVHLAARVHVIQETAADSLMEFRRVNVQGTSALAVQANRAGVRRFVLVSSIKVNGEHTAPGRPFDADDSPCPTDAYGVSKLEAEQALREVAAKSAMQFAIVRPPLVYGPGVKANFLSMMRWICRGVPLPFGAVTGNRRSLVALENLADLLLTCVDHPAAANRTLLVSDGEDLSTADLMSRIGVALGRPARLIAVPPALLVSAAKLAGRADLSQRLLGSLQVDLDKTKRLLGWSPPSSVTTAIANTARHYLHQGRT